MVDESSAPQLAVQLLANSLAKRDIELGSEQREAFQTYAAMLIDWNSNRFNLTRLVAPEQIALNHFLDSIAVASLVKIPFRAKVIDIGTGAGFPGLALKIFRPDLNLILIESTSKKLSFCRAVAETLHLENVEFVHGRAEDIKIVRSLQGVGNMVTARAVAPLQTLLSWAAPYISDNGFFIAWKGARVHEEYQDAEPIADRLGIKMQIMEQKLSIEGVEAITHYYVVCRRRR